MEAGARGYLRLSASIAELLESIARLLAGEVVFSPELAPAMFSRLAELTTERRRRRRLEALLLTSRELGILRLLAEDLSNKEIAQQQSLSVHTIKNHVHHILKKLGVRKRSEAVRMALERSWIEGG